MMPKTEALRLIWITPKFPLGTPDGARHATSVLLRHLTHMDVKIDLLSLLPHDEIAEPSAAVHQLGVSSCTLIRRKKLKWFPFPNLNIPMTFQTFSTPDVKATLHDELLHLLAADHRRPTFIVGDGLHVFAAFSEEDLKSLSRKCQGVFYRAHNYETELWEQCAQRARSPLGRWGYLHQAARVRNIERQVLRNVSGVAPVSEDDARKFRTLLPGTSCVVVPIGMDFPAEEFVMPVPVTTPVFEILFVGRLDWLPNTLGLAWFLEKVWPALVQKRSDCVLKIAGVGDSGWLRRFEGLPGVQVLGRVGDLTPLYQRCAITLAPLFHGSGTRVKILESARYARPVVSTALGAEGSGFVAGTTYYRAETKEEWVNTLACLTSEKCREMGWRAYMDARDRVDGKKTAALFRQALTDRLPSPEELYAHVH